MPRDDFNREVLSLWTRALSEVLPATQPRSTTWDDLGSMHDVLRAFAGDNRNHLMLPSGGGIDILDVCLSNERGCLDFKVTNRVHYVMRPAFLVLESFPKAPMESFLFLSLRELSPVIKSDYRPRDMEEVVDLGDGEYRDRSVWDEGSLGEDERGRRIPLPHDARRVCRYLKGNALLVAKASLWNRDSSTYDGRQDRMTPAEVRAMIERTLLELQVT